MVSLGLWVTYFIMVDRLWMFLGTFAKNMMSALPSLLPCTEGGAEPGGTLPRRLQDQKCGEFSEQTWP